MNGTSYTAAVKAIEVQENENYNRIYFGYAPTKFSASGNFKRFSVDGVSKTTDGCDLGWMMGLNVTKEHFLPLYIEAGIAMNADFGDNSKLINFEIPFGITYRLNIPNTEIYVSPYFGFHFKINVFWVNDKNNSYFDLIDDTHRFQFGMQLGGHIDFNHFYLGLGWDKDFISIADEERRSYDLKLNTSGMRINIGYTF